MSDCTCGYAERYAKNREDWDISRAPTSLFSVSSDGRPWPPYPVHHYSDCASLKDYPFEALASSYQCAKCGSQDIKTSFHHSGWDYRPHHHDYWRTDLGTYACLLTHRYRPVEHLDQRCGRCGFMWLTETIS